jgi:hypothetical protein
MIRFFSRSFLGVIFLGAALTFLIVPGVLIAVAFITGRGAKYDVAVNFLNIYALYGFVAVCIFLALGVPVALLYHRMRWESLTGFALGGMAVAIAGEALLAIAGIGYWDPLDSLSFARSTAILGASGLIAGLALWVVRKAGRRRLGDAGADDSGDAE